MNYYFTIMAATPSKIIQMYCGTDIKNSLEGPVQSDDAATGQIQMPPQTDLKAIENSIGKLFSPIAIANPGKKILIRLDGQNLITYWI